MATRSHNLCHVLLSHGVDFIQPQFDALALSAVGYLIQLLRTRTGSPDVDDQKQTLTMDILAFTQRAQAKWNDPSYVNLPSTAAFGMMFESAISSLPLLYVIKAQPSSMQRQIVGLLQMLNLNECMEKVASTCGMHAR